MLIEAAAIRDVVPPCALEAAIGVNRVLDWVERTIVELKERNEGTERYERDERDVHPLINLRY